MSIFNNRFVEGNGSQFAHVVGKLASQTKPRRAIAHAELGIATVSIPA